MLNTFVAIYCANCRPIKISSIRHSLVKSIIFKLLQYDIMGNFLSIIQKHVFWCTVSGKIDNWLSPPIESCVGEKQG